MSKTMVELTEGFWVDPEAVIRVAPVERKAGLTPQCRIYFAGAASGVPVDLSAKETVAKLVDGSHPDVMQGEAEPQPVTPYDALPLIKGFEEFDLVDGTRVMDKWGMLGMVYDNRVLALLPDGTGATRWVEHVDLIYPVRVLEGPFPQDGKVSR